MELFLLTLVRILDFYYYLLVAYILFSWIPSIRQSRFYELLTKVTDPYMRLFRGWFVFGQLDFTPIIGFFLYIYGVNALRFFVENNF